MAVGGRPMAVGKSLIHGSTQDISGEIGGGQGRGCLNTYESN